MLKTGKALSDTEIQEIINAVKGGMAISTVAKISGIGLQRLEKWMDAPAPRRGYTFLGQETIKEEDARNTIAIAKAYWDKFKVGDIMQALIKRAKIKPHIIEGPILEKKKEYIVILHNDKRTNIAFADILSKQTKIRHKIMDIGENKEVLSMG